MRWISYINLFAIAIVLLLVGEIFILTSKDEPQPVLLPPKKYAAKLPENPFAQPEETLQAIDSGPLALHFSPQKLNFLISKKLLSFMERANVQILATAHLLSI